MRIWIPDDWDGETYCRYAICWPNSPKWLAILRGQVTEIARGWFWDETTGDLLGTLDQARATLDYNIELREVIMACSDQGLEKIAAAIIKLANSQCCDGTILDTGGVQGVVNDGIDDIPIYGSIPPGSITPGIVPEGFEGTYEEYLTAKCNAAHAILDGVIQTCRNWAYINFAQTAGLVALLVAALAGWVVVPLYLITILIGGAIGLVGLQAALIGLADGLEARRDDIVCILIETDSTELIISRLSQVLASIISLLGVTGPVGAFLRLVASILFSTDTLNQLFEASVAAHPTRQCNCVGCDPLNDLIIQFDTGVEGFAIDAAFGGSVPTWEGIRGSWAVSQVPGVNRLRIANSQSITNTKVAVVKSVSHEIGTGDHLLSQIEANITITYALALFDVNKQFIAAFTQGNIVAGNIDVDLSPYAGQTVEYILHYVAKADAAIYHVENFGISILCSP